jgi:two-component system, OmpR family, sensor histidine kinase KdpD
VALLVERTARATLSMETERTRNELLSAVTHDVRTPLTAIRGAAETLLEGAVAGDAQRREMLESIRDETQRLDHMIGDLLDLTRLESGALVVRKEPCPLEELVDSALSRLEARVAGREIRREAPDEVLVAPVDPILLEQVLVNLIENAIKYSPSGPIDVRVLRRGARAAIEVADRGPGIAPGEEERIFEKFYRGADGSRASGTGLGLTVSRAIVRAHGGELRATNAEGGGAVFRVEIPLESAGRS